MTVRQRSLGIGLGLLLMIGLAACGDSESSGSTGPAIDTTTVTSPATTAETTPSTPATTAPEMDHGASGRVIPMTVADGTVTGGGRISVSAGEEVTLRVTSDVVDEIHLHGYDRYVDLAVGTPTDLTFTAEITGVFEVELHDAKLKLADLVIR